MKKMRFFHEKMESAKEDKDEENNFKKYDIILVYYLLYLYNKITYHGFFTMHTPPSPDTDLQINNNMP